MGKYISLDAVLAVIDKRINQIATGITEIPLTGREKADATLEREVFGKVRSLIDSLEVKEVGYVPMDNDFERDAVNFCFDNALNTTPRIAKTIAKHFFELGLSASNPVTASDRGTAEEIIINLKRVEQDYRIDLTKEIGWVRNQVKKGE